MEKTGESYAAARTVLIAKVSVPGWDHWLGVLDQWDGTAHTHTRCGHLTYLKNRLEMPADQV